MKPVRSLMEDPYAAYEIAPDTIVSYPSRWGSEAGTWDRVKEVTKGRLSDVLGAVIQGVTAPRRAMSGEATSIEDALATAGLSAAGAAFGKAPPGSSGMFLRTQYATPEELMRRGVAEQLLDEGVSAEGVRQRTNWHKDSDGDWYFEVSDNDALLNFGIPRDQDFPGDFFVKHPELERRGVDLSKIDINYGDSGIPPGVSGGFAPFRNRQQISLAEDMSAKVKSTLMHELQHYLDSEGGTRPSGSNEDWMRNVLDSPSAPLFDLTFAENILGRALTPEESLIRDRAATTLSAIQQEHKSNPQYQYYYDLYRADETERRAESTASRTGMTDSARRVFEPPHLRENRETPPLPRTALIPRIGDVLAFAERKDPSLTAGIREAMQAGLISQSTVEQYLKALLDTAK